MPGYLTLLLSSYLKTFRVKLVVGYFIDQSFSLAEQAYIGYPYPLIYSENFCFSPSKDVLSSRTFTSLAIEVIYKTFIVQQCLLLESFLNTDYTSKCVTDPVKSLKPITSSKETSFSYYLHIFSISLSN